MLYSIIPPILVVLSLVGIIVFLVKKAPAMDSLREKLRKEESGDVPEKNIWKRIFQQGKDINDKEINHRFLLILEKITRKFKIIFLKLENLFTHWSELIRLKRKIKEDQVALVEKDNKNILLVEDEVSEVFKRKQKKKNPITKIENILLKENEELIVSEDNIPSPKKQIEKKDLFEKILIERIAANPKDIEAYERLGEYYFEIENWNYAKECFKQVIKLNPQNSSVRGKIRRLEKMLSK